VPHIVEKLSTRAITLLQTALRSEVCKRSYAPSKSRESLLAGFRDFHAGVPGEKNHLDAGPVESHRVYYKGEGGGLPQVRAVVNLVCPCCLWLVLAPKVLQLCTNHFVWVVCRPVWVSSLSILPSPIPKLQHTPLPLKCYELGNVPQLLSLPLSFTWTHIGVLQGIGGVSVGVPKELPNLQSAITGVKIPCFEELFIWLKSYWSVDV
jgi:hypothetical protein